MCKVLIRFVLLNGSFLILVVKTFLVKYRGRRDCEDRTPIVTTFLPEISIELITAKGKIRLVSPVVSDDNSSL